MKKIFVIVIVSVIVLVAALIAVPFIFKDKIIAKAKDEINKTIDARVEFSGFDLALLSSFPQLTFRLDNFSIVGVKTFEGDTLARVEQLKLQLNLWDVISGSQYKINSIVLDKPYINIIVLKDGTANYNIAKADSTAAASTTESSNFSLALNSYAINNGKISYDDASLNLKLSLTDLTHNGKGDFTSDQFILSTITTIEQSNVWYGGIKYLSDVKSSLKADLDMDMKNMKFVFKENEIRLNELALGFDGFISMPGDDIVTDVKWTVKQNDFKSFISLIPVIYAKDFNSIKTSGKLAAKGFVKGVYNETSIPAYAVNLVIENGMFKYPSLPSAVNNVQVDLKINNPDGITDHTVIDLKRMHAELGAEPFDIRLHVTTPVSDPDIDASLKGTVNLANIKNFVPIDKGTDLNGILKADLVVKGHYSAIEKQQYENFNAAGSLRLSDMNYKSDDFKQGAYIKEVMLTFNPKNVTLNNFDVKTGSSNLQADGTLDNFLAYYLKNETLKATLNIRSSLLDINEMFNKPASNAEAAAKDTTMMNVVEIPSNVDFVMNTSVSKILYDNMIIENLKGKVSVRDAVLKIESIAFNTLDGTATMSGLYGTQNVKQPDIAYTMNISNFDIQKTVKTFSSVSKMAPVAERANGKFSTTLNVKGKLDQAMSPVLTSLTGGGRFLSKNVTVANFEPLNKLADVLKMEQYKKLEMKDLNFDFEFIDGRVHVKPFNTVLAGAKAGIEGSNGFDRTISYKMQLEIPKSLIPAAAQSAMTGMISKANAALGSNITIPDPMKVNVGIGGTVDKPVITTNAGESAKNAATAVKEAAIAKGKEEARKQADKLIAEAEIKAKQIKDAAKVSADQVKKEGYKQADELIKKAGSNPIAKMGAEKAADKLRKETDKKADQIISEGNKQADAVVNDARKKADELLK